MHFPAHPDLSLNSHLNFKLSLHAASCINLERTLGLFKCNKHSQIKLTAKNLDQNEVCGAETAI